MARFLIYSVLSVFSIFIMDQSCATATNSQNMTHKNLSASCNDFTTAFYKELSSNNDENIVSSTFSIHMILSHLSHGAESATLDEFTKVLCHYDKDSIKKGYQYLITQLNELKNVKLYIANTMYIQDEFELLTEFLTVGKEVYQSEISKVDFKLNVNVADKINSWVKEKTNNKILDLVSSDDFNEDIKLVLINAIYFNGIWLHAFNPKGTQERIFHVTKTEKKNIPTMHNKSKYSHGNIPAMRARFIEIPYTNTDIVMTILLPDEIDGLQNLQNNFSWKLLDSARREYDDIDLYLPKFKIEFTLDLKNILQKLGLTTMFGRNANFNRIANIPLAVSKVLHKAVIEVNEEGTEAAAATAAHIRLRRMVDTVEPQIFSIDRPFMFIIQHKPNNTPLFIGNVKDIEVVVQKDEL